MSSYSLDLWCVCLEHFSLQYLLCFPCILLQQGTANKNYICFLLYLFVTPKKSKRLAQTRAMDPHSFYVDPDPAFFLNADLDPDPGPGPA